MHRLDSPLMREDDHQGSYPSQVLDAMKTFLHFLNS
jgi:hypothetical protein